MMTNEVVDAWIAHMRGARCDTLDGVSKGEAVLYTDPRTRVVSHVAVVHVGPLVPNEQGEGEPASITVRFADGNERSTTMSNLRRSCI